MNGTTASGLFHHFADLRHDVVASSCDERDPDQHRRQRRAELANIAVAHLLCGFLERIDPERRLGRRLDHACRLSIGLAVAELELDDLDAPLVGLLLDALHQLCRNLCAAFPEQVVVRPFAHDLADDDHAEVAQRGVDPRGLEQRVVEILGRILHPAQQHGAHLEDRPILQDDRLAREVDGPLPDVNPC